MKKPGTELSAYLSLTLAILAPIGYWFLVPHLGWRFGMTGAVVLALLALLLGTRGSRDAEGPIRVIAATGMIVGSLVLIAGTYFLVASACGCVLRSDAKLF